MGLVLVAAGESRRLQLGERKPYLDLAGRPVFLRALDRFSGHDFFRQKVLVLNVKDRGKVEEQWGEELERLGVGPIVVGGATRQASVRKGVEALDAACTWVAIHDAVRPFVRADQVAALAACARAGNTAILAVPVKETIKESGDGRVIGRTVPRASLWAAQTPQVFPRATYLEVTLRAEAEGWEVTDDAQLFEMAGLPVSLVEGSTDNFKITTEADWRMAQALAAAGVG